MVRRGFEAYPRYQDYLNQATYWPSESSGEPVEIASMPPRYAASALSKLQHWAEHPASYARINHSDPVQRQLIVNQSALGTALAIQATGRTPEEPAEEVSVGQVMLALAHQLGKNTDLTMEQATQVCRDFGDHVKANWTVTVKSR